MGSFVENRSSDDTPRGLSRLYAVIEAVDSSMCWTATGAPRGANARLKAAWSKTSIKHLSKLMWQLRDDFGLSDG